MLFSLLPTAAFAGEETTTGGTEASTPAIASVGYAEKQADARTQIAKEMNSVKGTTDSNAGNDADDQTMWVIFKGLDKETEY
ncbi:hypothetical protein GUG51_18110, partial [Xanthomonas citri pv. citri]|nr:hypothetical protein [Xanthomonas citri pv. citri]